MVSWWPLGWVVVLTFPSGVEVKLDQHWQRHDENYDVGQNVDAGGGEVCHREIVATFREAGVPCAPGLAVTFEGLVDQ